MTQPNLVQLARAGDADAIAALMNATLQAIGITARVTLQADNLYILLESRQAVAAKAAIEFVRQGMGRLEISWLVSAVVCSRGLGDSVPAWVERIDVSQVNANPFMVAPLLLVDTKEDHCLPSPAWHRIRLFHLLLLTLPLLTLLSAGQIWRRYLAVDPSTAVQAESTHDKRRSPQPASDLDPFQSAMKQATRAATQSQAAHARAEWHQAATEWQRAIALLKRVPAKHPQVTIARQKIVEYQRYLSDLTQGPLSRGDGMVLKKTITGGLSPKSVVYSGNDRFFAQNMMYRHSITVYDRDYNLVKTISDRVNLSDSHYTQYKGTQQGAPVEAAFTQNGATAWVSNYQMYGAGFKSTADDTCSPSGNHDPSFVYRIDTQALHIDRAVQVGAVPKFVAASPDSRLVLVSNWCSWDVSVIDPQQNKEIRRLQVGPYPRGIAIDAKAAIAYIAVMGSYDIATIDLNDFSLGRLKGIGRSPRHLSLDPNGSYLYATLNGEGKVVKIDLAQRKVVSKVATGSAPRSMTIAPDGDFIYVVNYNSDTVSKIRTMDMKVVQTIKVNPAPIGITYDPKTHQVWVACYSGSIQVFQD